MHQTILSFGEILFDLFPSGRRLGGAPFNFVRHLLAFGFPVRLVTRVGKDDPGREILAALRDFPGMGTVQLDPAHETGKVTVELDARGIPDFHIASDSAYDYILYDEPVREALRDGVGLIYFGTLARRHPVSDATLRRILAENRSATVFCDVNLRQGFYTRDLITSSLAASHAVKLNDEELAVFRTLLKGSGSDESFIHFLMKRFHVEWFCLTRGAEGSELFHASGRNSVGRLPGRRIVDTVGAGDAYASVLAAGILKGWSPESILERATIFSGAICEVRGAVPEDPGFYEPYLSWFVPGSGQGTGPEMEVQKE